MKVRFVTYIILPLAKIYWRLVKPTTSGARAILVHKGSILLVRNLRNTYWSLPGGGKKKKETPEECLKRELREELSLWDVPDGEKIGTYSSIREGKKDTIHVYVILLPISNFKKRWELADAAWFPLENLPDTASPATRRRVSEYMSGMRNTTTSW